MRCVIPTNTNAIEEKIIGGKFTSAQFLWLGLGFVIGLIMFALFFVLTKLKILSLIIGIAFGSVGVPFAFYKKHEMTLFFYLKTKNEFKKKEKKLLNIRR